MLTGDTGREAGHRALTGGATDFVTKPFDIDEVLLRTRHMLQNALLRADLSEHNQRLSELVAVRSVELAEARETHQTVLASLGAGFNSFRHILELNPAV